MKINTTLYQSNFISAPSAFAAAFIALGLMLATPAGATLVEEDFSAYGTGSLTTSSPNGGVGWTANWSLGGTTRDYVVGGYALSYTGGGYNIAQASGAGVAYCNYSGAAGWRGAIRTLAQHPFP